MVREREWIERIEELCRRIWSVKSVDTREIAVFVQEMNPYLLGILGEIEKGKIQGVTVNELATQVEWIMEGLQYRDKMFLADILYFEIRNTLLRVREEV